MKYKVTVLHQNARHNYDIREIMKSVASHLEGDKRSTVSASDGHWYYFVTSRVIAYGTYNEIPEPKLRVVWSEEAVKTFSPEFLAGKADELLARRNVPSRLEWFAGPVAVFSIVSD